MTRQRAFQLRRLAQGECGYCADRKPVVSGQRRCADCAQKMKLRKALRALEAASKLGSHDTIEIT